MVVNLEEGASWPITLPRDFIVRVKPEGKDSWCTIREISYLL